MRKISFLVSMVAAMFLLCGMSAYAQVTQSVSSASALITAVSDMSSTGGTINLVPPFTNPASGITGSPTFPATSLAIGNTSGNGITLSANAPITINCGDNSLSVYGTGVSGSNGNLIIGKNITVTGSGSATVQNNDASSAKGAIEIASGGSVVNTAPANGVAVNASAGRSIIDAGAKILTQSPNGIGLKCGNSYTTIITGGEISAGAAGATALLLDGTPGTNFDIKNVYIHAYGANVTGIATQNGWTVKLDNVQILTESSNGSDVGIMSTGGGGNQSGGIVWMPQSAATPTVVVSATPYVASNMGAIIDFNNLPITITANPAAGGVSLPANIVLTAKYADGTPVGAGIAIGMNTDIVDPPTAADITLADNNTVKVSAAGTLNAAVCAISTYSGGIASQLFSKTSFTYSASGIADVFVDKDNIFIANNVLNTPVGNVQVYSIGGQLLLNTVATGEGIDVSALDKGVYIVKVGTEVSKVVK